jgi:UPF0755 protein
MKKLLFLPLLALVSIAVGIYWFYLNSKPVSSDKSFQDFLISKGTGASQVANNLSKAKLIKSPLAFKIYVQVTGKAGSIQAGEYRLSPSYNLFQLLSQLGKGPSEIWVTVPEGLRREEIAMRFATALEKDQDFIDEFMEASNGLEGHLFPDTYLFPKTVSATTVVNRMKSIFDAKISGLENNTSYSQAELVALASLIERETKTDAERPVVAGILMNRLDIGMPLQVDASVQYAVANTKYKSPNSSIKWWEPVLRNDLQINSPYNTYRFAGIPPGPIASPGLSSLEAAFNPEESDYLYYIHDSKGGIHYAKTLEQHNKNVQDYLN